MTTREPKLPSGLSPSSIDLYHQCPRRFEFEKILGFSSKPGYEAVLGTFVHLTLEYLMELPSEDRDLEAANECAKGAWAETVVNEEFLSLSLDPNQMREFKRSAWGSIENYFEMEPPGDVEVRATEQFINCEIDGVPLRGIIDRLDVTEEGIVVSDYKNGKVPAPKYRKSKWDQLNLYGAMVEHIEGERPIKGRLLFTAHQEILEYDFTDDSISAVLKKTKDTWTLVNDSFESGDWAPKTGPLCAWCHALPKCPDGMGHVTMLARMGRIRKDSPGYHVIRNPQEYGIQ